MKFTVVAVGKLKERFWSDACAEYLKRLQPYAKTQVREIADVDPRKAGGVDGARDKEGAAICAELEKLGADTHVVLLAIDGKERSSEGLSKRLDNLMLQGKSNFAFVIGGSDGVSTAVRQRADELLSFGPITRPTTSRASCCLNSSIERKRFPTASRTINNSPVRPLGREKCF